MVVLLVPAGRGDVRLGREAASGLARLGVRRATLLRDPESLIVILDGWGFDPDASGETAVNLVAGDDLPCRVLRPLAQLAIDADGGDPNT
jgi:hypothetical protein